MISEVFMAPKRATFVEEDGCLVRVIHLDRVAKARLEAIAEQEVEPLAQVFKALADPTRIRIVTALRSQEMCVCDLAAFLGVSESGVSHQMRRLKDLNLVKSRREGQVLYYSLDDHHVCDLINIGLEHVRE